MIFQYINVCPVPREMLKTEAYGLGFQHLPRDLANVNAWKTMFDPYIQHLLIISAGLLWKWFIVTGCISDWNDFRYRYQVLPKKSFDFENTSTMIA